MGRYRQAITRSLPNANCYDEARTSPNLKFEPEKPVQRLSPSVIGQYAIDAYDHTRFATPYDDAFVAASRRASSCSRRYADPPDLGAAFVSVSPGCRPRTGGSLGGALWMFGIPDAAPPPRTSPSSQFNGAEKSKAISRRSSADCDRDRGRRGRRHDDKRQSERRVRLGIPTILVRRLLNFISDPFAYSTSLGFVGCMLS